MYLLFPLATIVSSVIAVRSLRGGTPSRSICDAVQKPEFVGERDSTKGTIPGEALDLQQCRYIRTNR